MPKQKKGDDEALLVFIADLHINSLVGLCPPYLALDNGGQYWASKAQRVVWSAWRELWDEIEEKKNALGVPLYGIFNGDVGDKNTHDKAGLISRNAADEIKFCAMVLERPCELIDYLFIVRGTPAHSGPQASLEELVARDLGAIRDEENGTHSWWWLKLKAGGVTFDIAHHARNYGWKPHTRHPAAMREAFEVQLRYLLSGERPPDIALRGHGHYCSDSGTAMKTRAFYSDPWQLTTAYGRRMGSTGQIEPVGARLIHCRNGEYTQRRIFWEQPRKKAWTSPAS